MEQGGIEVIKLSRNRGVIGIPKSLPLALPPEVSENILKISVDDLKKMCDLWQIPRIGVRTQSELRKVIQKYFEKKDSDSDSDIEAEGVKKAAVCERLDEKSIMDFSDERDCVIEFKKLKLTSDLLDDLINIKVAKTTWGRTQKNSRVQAKALITILEHHGFKSLDGESNRRYVKSGVYCHLDSGKYYVEQPYGSQKSPDFILVNVVDGFHKTVRLECKVGCDKIMWNDGFPQDGDIYVFTCTKLLKTSVYMGSDLINETALQVHKKFVDVKDRLNSEFRGAWCQNNISGISSDVDQIRERFGSFASEEFPSYLRGVSLFAGAGGDTHGMEMSGVKVVGFVELDPVATKTHLKNFPDSVHIGGNITTIPDEKFLAYRKKVDFLFGGFPCQSFSHSGKKDINDPRGQLYVDFVRATRLMEPKWVIGENVRGILSRKDKKGVCMADVVVSAFKRIGYTMKYKLIDTSRFGIAQARERVIFVGWPDAASGLADIDAADAFSIPEECGLGDESSPRRSVLRDVLEYSLDDAMPMPQRIIAKIPEGKFILGGSDEDVPTGAPPTNLVKCAEKKTDKDDITFKTRGKSTFSCIVDIDDVSRTLICTYMHMPRLFVPVSTGENKYMRPYTVLECQRIQGFPDSFQFVGKKGEQIKQIGNAVPPVVISGVINYLIRGGFVLTHDLSVESVDSDSDESDE